MRGFAPSIPTSPFLKGLTPKSMDLFQEKVSADAGVLAVFETVYAHSLVRFSDHAGVFRFGFERRAKSRILCQCRSAQKEKSPCLSFAQSKAK